MYLLKIKYFLFSLLALLLFSSCEEVIILDLEDESPRVIIEANMDATSGKAAVIVSKSNAFYEEGQQVRLEDAQVYLQDPAGNILTLEANEEKFFTVDNLLCEAGQSYSFEVVVDGESYTASTIVPYPVELLEVDTSIFTPPFGGSTESFYQMYIEWQDPPEMANYYQIKTYENGIAEVGTYMLYNDVTSDGNRFRRPIMQFFELANLYKIELLSLDKNSFEYLQDLSTVQQQGGGASAPFNPIGNWSNDALGYFGISYSSTIDIQL